MERTHSDNLHQRFKDLREAIAAWSKETVAMANLYTSPDPSETAKLTVSIVRTIFSKWSIEIITVLYTLKSVGFTELRKSVLGISARVLSSKLRMLEEEDIIERKVLNTRPPSVQYALTEKGWTIATLGEPVILYLRLKEGLYRSRKPLLFAEKS